MCCYILIIPGFGIVSHVISAFAGKPIFGQDGPKYLIGTSQQTICGETIHNLQTTAHISLDGLTNVLFRADFVGRSARSHETHLRCVRGTGEACRELVQQEVCPGEDLGSAFGRPGLGLTGTRAKQSLCIYMFRN
jgi:hypothetical protein